MRAIDLQFIEHRGQRYNTVGDWFYTKEDSTLHVRVSHLPRTGMMYAIAVHELVEALLCEHYGIPPEVVDEFDIEFEDAGREGEPGDAEDSPYRLQHCMATAVERMVIAMFGISWARYEAEVDRLWEARRITEQDRV